MSADHAFPTSGDNSDEADTFANVITVFAGREGAKAEHLKRELEAAGKRIGPPMLDYPDLAEFYRRRVV